MRLITRDTDYALRALIFIAGAGKRVVTAGELVRALGIPRPFLRKILQRLNKNKLLRSYRGRGGGFKLLMPPPKISLTEVIEVFQGPLEIDECLFRKRICPNVTVCKLKAIIDNIKNQVSVELGNITLANLLR